MRFRNNCLLIAVVGLTVWAGGLVWLTGCATHLHPLLVEYNGGKPLTDEQVDIRIERLNYAALQVACIKDDPWAILSAGLIFGCARMTCEGKKLWETDKHCTCQVWMPTFTDRPLAHELSHCYGYEDTFY